MLADHCSPQPAQVDEARLTRVAGLGRIRQELAQAGYVRSGPVRLESCLPLHPLPRLTQTPTLSLSGGMTPSWVPDPDLNLACPDSSLLPTPILYSPRSYLPFPFSSWKKTTMRPFLHFLSRFLNCGFVSPFLRFPLPLTLAM
jgi:hypothetical protein